MIKKVKNILKEKNILSLTTSVIVAVLGLLSFLLLTRELDQKTFGNWVLYVTLATLFDQIRFGLTSTALVRFASSYDKATNQSFLGTSYKIGLFLVGAVAVILWTIYFIILNFNINLNEGYLLFFAWYPVLALFNLSWNNSVSYFQAEQNFKRILFIQLLNVGSFVLFLIINNTFLHWGITAILLAHLGANLLPSLLVFVKSWDGLKYVRKATAAATREMLNFGKYSMGTLVGSSLLRSADALIIGLSPILGSVGVAQYAIPLKLADLLGIPLRSFSITAFPKMAKKSLAGDMEGLKKIFYGYSGVVTLLFIPVAILGFLFAEKLVWLLGGNEYKDSIPLLASIFRIFSVYAVLLPIDRFTGIALDSINKPRFNFRKVMIMALANVVGDLIGVFIFDSLEVVALVTVLFTLIGIVAGYYYLNREIGIKIKFIFTETWHFFKTIKTQI